MAYSSTATQTTSLRTITIAALFASSTISPTWSQSSTTPQSPQQLEAVTISAKAAPVLDAEAADVSGFDTTLAKTPQSITVIGSDLIAATAMQTLSQALRLDASISDNYNTPGYIENLTVRGFMLEHLGNYRRNGLTISNYTPLAFENKERVEILKGISGLQSGVSAPGGLVNYVTKKPLRENFTTALINTDHRGSAKAHVDSNTQLGIVGVRLNVATEKLRSYFNDADGSRQFASLALSAPVSANSTLSADFEYHRKSQPSVPGLGLLDRNGDGVGETLPSRINPRLNLNNQPWSQPFQTEASTAQLALEHRLNSNWYTRATFATMQTRTNDRLAFLDGCTGSDGHYVYPGLCSDGSVDMYDFRSDGIKRHLSSWDVYLEGHFKLGTINNTARFGSSGYNTRNRPSALQAYNWIGTTNIYAPVTLPENPNLTTLNTDTDDKAIDGYATLSSQLSHNLQSFIGIRLSQLKRNSKLSDGSNSVSLSQNVSTPWTGLAWSINPDVMLYASWGQGVELEVTPNRPDKYTNYGAVLPALKSRQTEIGGKWQINPRLLLSLAAFNIEKPFADERTATGNSLPTLVAGNKRARHRGIELNIAGRVNQQLSLQGSATWLDATYIRAENEALLGQRVTNVPRFAASLFADYKLQFIPGLSLSGLAWVQDGKSATADSKTELPRIWQLDGGLRYQHKISAHSVQWRLNIENLTNHIYWREAAPTYWGGVYLFTSAPRTVRASVSIDW